YEVGQTLGEGRREGFYRNVRATAESGWDFSSRWLRDPKDLRTLETTELIPVDLNSLLYHAERTIAALRAFRGGAGDADVARQFAQAAEDRRRALLAAAFDPTSGYFYDVRWRSGERVTGRRRRVRHAGWVRVDERGGAGAPKRLGPTGLTAVRKSSPLVPLSRKGEGERSAPPRLIADPSRLRRSG